MAARWDRFSWFGLLPVSEAGTLGTLPLTYEASKIIPALEAILIEALEPGQNRKRGDDLSAVEYIQREDPEIQRKRKREIIAEALAGSVPTGIPSAPQPAADSGFGLTQREAEVLRLVAKGLTNQLIAESLFISPKTVSSHLVSIFGKLGVTSRASATRFALDHGLG